MSNPYKVELGDEEYLKLANEMANNHRKFDSFMWDNADMDCVELYTIRYMENRDSTLLSQSNSRVAWRLMWHNFHGENDNWWVEKHNHWLCGWIQCFVIRVWVDKTKKQLTDEFIYYLENIYLPLEQYPILDEEDYSILESEANYQNFLSCFYFDEDEDADIIEKAWDWITDNGYYDTNLDDRGCYPTEEHIEYIKENFTI